MDDIVRALPDCHGKILDKLHKVTINTIEINQSHVVINGNITVTDNLFMYLGNYYDIVFVDGVHIEFCQTCTPLFDGVPPSPYSSDEEINIIVNVNRCLMFFKLNDREMRAFFKMCDAINKFGKFIIDYTLNVAGYDPYASLLYNDGCKYVNVYDLHGTRMYIAGTKFVYMSDAIIVNIVDHATRMIKRVRNAAGHYEHLTVYLPSTYGGDWLVTFTSASTFSIHSVDEPCASIIRKIFAIDAGIKFATYNIVNQLVLEPYK